jgi:hypothetical protein
MLDWGGRGTFLRHDLIAARGGPAGEQNDRDDREPGGWDEGQEHFVVRRQFCPKFFRTEPYIRPIGR